MSRQSDRRQAAREVRERLARQQRKQRMLWTSVIAVAALLLAAGIGYAVYVSQRPDEGFAVPPTASADETGLRVGEGPVTVELYLDYLCPACKQFEEQSSATLKRYVDEKKITLVYHPVAILDRLSTNAYSSRAAAGAGCAAEQRKLVPYTDALYADQPAEGGPGHTDAKLTEIASGAGLDRSAFGSCLSSGRYADWVRHVTAGMDERRLSGTPSVFVAGKQLSVPTEQALRAAIDAAKS